MKRPLLPVALAYVSGILVAGMVTAPLPAIFCAAFLLLVAALTCRSLRPALLYPLLLLAGWANALLHSSVLSPVDLRRVVATTTVLATVRGHLLETPGLRVYRRTDQPAWRTQARLDVSAICPARGTWQAATGCIAVTTPVSLTNFFSGQSVEITGVLAPPKTAMAEGMFDYREYLRRQGIYYQLQAESERDWRVLASPALPLADRFSAWARRALALGLPAEDESLRLEWALALGWKTALTEEASEPFVRAATYHIFAVDGLRMAIVFGIFFYALRAIGLPRAFCGAVLIPLIWFYVALTGWPASAIRATVMLTVIIVGWILKRPSDPMNSLFAAALIILVWEPQQLFQAGFQLSFFVVLALILTIPPLFDVIRKLTAPDPLLPAQLHRRWHPAVGIPARYIGDITVTSFAAWIGSIPVVAYYFNILTPVSTPANIIAVPVCVLVLISNLISLVLAAWIPAAAELFNQAGWFCMECIRVTSIWFAKWPAAYCYTPAPGLHTICVYYAVLLALVSGWALRPKHRTARLVALSALVLLWAGDACLRWPVTTLSILPVHGGTAIYCDGLGHKHDLLIDVGSSNSVQFITKPFLRARGVNGSPPLLLTHGDLHHLGGVEPFRDIFAMPHIYTSPVRFRSAPCRRILGRLNQVPGLIQQISQKDVIADWTVLHPSADDRFTRADDGAVVLKGTLDTTRVLLLSDLGRTGQKALLERTADLRAEIVVAGLPAADEPLGPELIQAIQPKLIIISDSELPIAERASPKLRARLERTGLPVLYTRTAGAVTLEFHKGSWRLRSLNGLRLSSRESDLKSMIEHLSARPLAPPSPEAKQPDPGMGKEPTDEDSSLGPADSDEH